jgi:two-component system sensor histidine kinase BaeS
MTAMRSLFAKILLAQVIAVVLALLVVVIITRASLDRGFIDFLERQESAVLEHLAPVLGELYATRGGWDFLRDEPHNWLHVLHEARPLRSDAAGRARLPPGSRRRDGPSEGLADGLAEGLAEGLARGPPAGDEPFRWLRSFDRLQMRQRLFLLDERREYLAGAEVVAAGRQPLQPVIAGDSTVGWVGFVPMRQGLPPEARRFLRGQLGVLGVSLLVALVLAGGLSYALARQLSRPVRRLGETVSELSRGHYGRRAAVTGHDEIGHLADNVNRLAETLEQNRSARRRWMADIAHELRTPVAILKGEVEALADGVRQPDRRTFASLAEEIDQLGVLVNDLQSLALADAGALNLQQQALDLTELLRQVADAFRDRMAERGIRLELELPGALCLYADPQRLRQLFHNLLENAARYVSDGGRVCLIVDRTPDGVGIRLEDSGPGVGENHLGRLFERFYRVEPGRSRAGGGSGLGLAICRSIVEAHGGRIHAEPSPLGGLAIHLALPGVVDGA